MAPTKTPPPDITVTREPPPDLVAATRTPPPDVAAVRTPAPSVSEDYSSPIAAAAAAAASEADQVTPPPEPKPEPEPAAAEPETDGGALPTLAMQANAGLATLPAVALTDAEGLRLTKYSSSSAIRSSSSAMSSSGLRPGHFEDLIGRLLDDLARAGRTTCRRGGRSPSAGRRRP